MSRTLIPSPQYSCYSLHPLCSCHDNGSCIAFSVSTKSVCNVVRRRCVHHHVPTTEEGLTQEIEQYAQVAAQGHSVIFHSPSETLCNHEVYPPEKSIGWESALRSGGGESDGWPDAESPSLHRDLALSSALSVLTSVASTKTWLVVYGRDHQ